MPEEGNHNKMWDTAEEVKVPEVASIQGSVPDWIRGTYLRVGPGMFDFDSGFTMGHWFDGYAIVSKFEIKDNKVIFTTKYLDSDAYTRACAAKKPVICEFGTRAMSEPGRGLLSRIVSSLIPEFSDNANINMFRIGKELYITGESCYFRNLSLDTLKSPEKFDSYKCFGLNLASAHPLVDKDGTTYNIGASVLTGLKYHFVRIPPPSSGNSTSKEVFKKSKIITSIPSRWNTLFSYNHSFGMTENYLILIEQPFVVNATKLLSYGLSRHGQNQCFSDWIEWRPELGNKFYIVEKKTGRLIKTDYMSEMPFFFLHFINCYEDQRGNIVLELSMFDTPEAICEQDLAKLRSNYVADDATLSFGAKFILPVVEPSHLQSLEEGHSFLGEKATDATAVKKGKTVTLAYEIITEKGLELPAINKQFGGKRNKFFWATGLVSETTYRNCICKVDVDSKDIKKWSQNDHIFGEPVFIPRPGSSQEDDGVLMACMTNKEAGQPDSIFFFDAATMEKIGRVDFQNRVPPSIHGLFLPQ